MTFGPHGLDRAGHAADETSAADRDDDARQVGHVGQQLEPERRLPEDDVGVIEGVHEWAPRLLGPGARGGDAVVDRIALEVDDAPEAAHRRHLRHRRIAGM